MTNQFDIESSHKSSSRKKKIIIAVIAILMVALLILDKDEHHIASKPLNIIFMIGDGFGPAAAVMARAAMKQRTNGNITSLNLDKYLVGTVRTYSSSSMVTDSAAGATAYATGHKSYNGAISVDPIKMKPLGTLFEAAQVKGIRTGVAVTTRISDATPACFFAHATSRKSEDFIISQLLEKNLTVALGGGALYFNKTVFENAANANNNYKVVRDREAMLNVTEGKILGVFVDYDMPYEIDRINQKIDVPTLNEMTVKSLELINQNNENGFLLMVEGSQIDIAAHSNDAAGQIWETFQFDQAFQTVIDFAKKDGNTLVIVTADHETGGITLGMQPDPKEYPQYEWHPETLLKLNASAHYMATQLFNTTLFPTIDATIITNYVNAHADGLNITFTSDEMNLLMFFATPRNDEKVWNFEQFLGQYISRRAWVGFTTGGHTGVDVNLYYYYSGDDEDLQEDHIRANVENIDVANFIAKAMDLDLPAMTAKYANFVPSP
ncbi:alkaline phosphatase [Heterostelium album PN500]|uniref:Alkaline phosphatase n=1 Tax=Heterostelium pallidum (strain ATCC 26659 / Pp 5 / PN500) TaxID=670386 RepID=D3B3B5_HETP5|nr:alkaline phosphatase [Heterostelium album PN500]EFA83813.1 alkaline phosphatase [Heterostelium album PN500]|eukprot:XP_020435930.1 alkaline phosphatase [Heterostelium album PN500]